MERCDIAACLTQRSVYKREPKALVQCQAFQQGFSLLPHIWIAIQSLIQDLHNLVRGVTHQMLQSARPCPPTALLLTYKPLTLLKAKVGCHASVCVL